MEKKYKMKQFYNVLSFYLKKQLRSKGFWIISAILIIFACIGCFAAKKMSSGNDDRSILIVNYMDSVSTDELERQISDEVNSNIIIENGVEEDLQYYQNLSEENNQIIILLKENSDFQMIVFGEVSGYEQKIQQIRNMLFEQKYIVELNKLTLSQEQKIQLSKTNMNVDVVYYTETDDAVGYIIVMILILIMVMFIIMYSNSALGEIAYLKSNRIMEILITSIKPLPLYLGINIAYCLGPMIQLGLTILVTSIMIPIIGVDLQKLEELSSIGYELLGAEKLIIYIIFLLLAYFLYSLLSTSIISIISKSEDVISISVPMAYLALAQYFLGMIAINNDSTMIKIFSYIPFTSPAVMFVRLAYGNVGMVQVLISLVILLLSVVMIARWGAGYFAHGISYYGNTKEFTKMRDKQNI